MLTLEHVDAGYGRVQVLRGLSFGARAGEVTCVMGRNGAGKTTMLRAIMGQVAVTSGRILLDGAALEGLAPTGSRNSGSAMCRRAGASSGRSRSPRISRSG